MMRSFGKFVLTMGALALLASPAWAQGRGGFGGGFGGGGAILMAPNVQKDLKLSDDQISKIQPTLQEVREKHSDDFQGLRDLSQEERQEKMRSLTRTMTQEIKKGIGLSEEQSKRYDQISLQAQGLQAFADPRVQEKLKLTSEQRDKIRDLQQSGRGNFANLKDASEEERAAALRKMAEDRRENLAKVQALLTDDQKSAWKELTGEPIEIQFQRRRPND